MKTKKLIYVLFLIASVLCAVGCGTRKSSTQIDKVDLKTDTQTEVKETDNTKTKTDVYTDTEKQETTEVETIEPIDASKPFSYNGKEYKNTKITKRKTNVLSKEKSKVNQGIENDKKVVKKERNKGKANVKSKAKQVVSEKGNFWNWIILILILLGVTYFVLWSRKIVRYKEKLEL